MPQLIPELKSLFRKRDAYPAHLLRIYQELEKSLTVIQDFDQIAFNILGKIREAVRAAHQVFFIYDQDLGEFRIAARLGYDDASLGHHALSRRDRLVRWLKVNKSCLDVRRNPGVVAHLGEAETRRLEELGLDLLFPLVAMNRMVAVLGVGPREGGTPYSKRDISFVELLLPQTAIVLENALLYREQRERFRRMLRADKLATVGELAAGAAHEIRNPLTAIRSALQYMEGRNPDDVEKKLLRMSLRETERIDGILSALLAFSKPSEMRKDRHDLLQTLEESLALITVQAGARKIALVRKFPKEPIMMSGDRSQIKQLFLNLFLNSIQAMEAGGEIRVEADLRNSHQAFVTVADTGTGIPEEYQDKVFNPFFTTKKTGTGLGLSICYSIVKAHDGDISVKSRPGEGTIILVTLPMT